MGVAPSDAPTTQSISNQAAEMTISERFAAHAARTRFEDLPAEAAETAKIFILDTIGVGIAGSATPEARSLFEVARGWGAGDEARVWGAGSRLPAGSAALVNAHFAHCLEFDPVHEPGVVHPVTVVFAALLADVERRVARGEVTSGRDLITAVAVGVDFAAGLGDVTSSALRFFRPSTAGIFGAVAAVANARRMEVEHIADAFGIAYGDMSGTMQPHTEGSTTLPLQMGFNARGSLTAIDLAIAGHTGPREVFEGPFGYFGLIETAGDPEILAERLGRQWEITRTSHKPFPSGRATHTAIDGALQLQAEHGFVADQVIGISVRAPSMIHNLVSRRVADDPTPNYLRLSLPFQVASALIDGRVDLDTSRPERLADPQLRRLVGLITTELDDNPNPNAYNPQTVTITCEGSISHSITLPNALGSPPNPLSRDQRVAKFNHCIDFGAPGWSDDRAQAVIEIVESLEQLEDATTLLELL